MKKRIYTLALISAFALSACVDDFTDANPPELLDAPTIRISGSGAEQTVVSVPANQYQSNYQAYVKYGVPVEYTVTVVEAPGKTGTITVTPSVPDFGTVTINESSVAALQGQESGEFKFTFTPNPNLAPDEDRTLNLVVAVSDTQVDEDGEADPKTTTLTIPTTLVNGSCFSNSIAGGDYRIIEASGILDGGETFNLDTLKKYSGTMNVLVSIEQERPGLYTINEVTGGVWPLFYPTRANPELTVNLCGNTIDEDEIPLGPRTFIVDGTVNADNTISITWSYFRPDGATPVNPATGTYKLEIF